MLRFSRQFVRNKLDRCVLLLAALAVLLSGCGAHERLPGEAIVMGAALDESERGKMAVTLQVYKPSAASGQTKGTKPGPYINMKAIGGSVGEAVRVASAQLGRKPQFSHMKAVVVSDRLVRKVPLASLLELFYRDAEPRLDCPVMIAHGLAADYMAAMPSIESIPSVQFASEEKTASGFAGTSAHATLLSLALQLRGQTGSAVLPYLAQSPPETGKVPKFAGSAVIKAGTMADRLQGKNGEGLLMLLNQYRSGVMTLPCPSEAKTAPGEPVEIREVKVKRKIGFTAGGVSVVYRAHAEARPLELSCSAVDTPADKKAYEQRVSAEIKKRMEAALKRLQKDRADVTGIGDAVYKARPVLWRKWKEDWEERFASVKFRVEAAASLAPDAVAAGKPQLTYNPDGRR